MSTATAATAATEATGTSNIMTRVRKMLEKAESIENMSEADLMRDGESGKQFLLSERDMLNRRAAELIAKYGIDRAMMAARKARTGDPMADRKVMVPRPFSEEFQRMLTLAAHAMGIKCRHIKVWNELSGPKAKGGIPRGGWDFGVRLFGYESDLERVDIMFASLRNQAIKGMRRVISTESQFGQTQKADRVSYLKGFRSAVYWRIDRAERAARAAREAQEEELRDQAMLAGDAAGASAPGVALVLADRKKALDVAWDLANGITQADRARWAERARLEQERVKKEQAAGTYQEPKFPKFRSRKPYEPKGRAYGQGYADGENAELGLGPASVEDIEMGELES